MTHARYFRLVSVVLAFTLVLEASAAVIHSAGSSLLFALQGDPPQYEGTPDAPYLGDNPARDPVYQNGAWDEPGIEALGALELDVEARMNMPVTTAPAVAPYNPPPTNPNPEQKSDTAPVPDKSGGSPASSFADGEESKAPFLRGQIGGGKPMPWEAAFPGGGSNSIGAIVNSNTGNRHTTVPLVSIPIRGGGSMGVNLYHNSVTYHNGFWGQKWSSDLDATLIAYLVPGTSTTDFIVIRWGDGTTFQYNRDNLDIHKFNAPAGIYHSIQENYTSWVVTMKDGTKYNFDGSAGYYTAGGTLSSIQDRDLNTIQIQCEAASGRPVYLKDPLLRTFSFGYTDGRVTSLKDCAQINSNNRLWTFGYTTSATGKDLTSITYPPVTLPSTPTTITRTFGYSPQHNITSETDGRGKIGNAPTMRPTRIC